jgi:L-ribulokinase
VILTSGLSQSNVLLMQLVADILGRDVHVPQIIHATAMSAAIHGAVAAGVVADYTEARGGGRQGPPSLQTTFGSAHTLSDAVRTILQA